MRYIYKLFALFILLQQFAFSQTKTIDSLKQSFISIYKEIIDSAVSDEEMKIIADSLFNNTVKNDQEIFKRIADFVKESAVIKEKEYTVAEGDCLWTIAARETGDPYNWNKIYEINDTHIKNPDLIFPGQIIKILTLNKVITPDSSVSKLLAGLLMPEKENIIHTEKTDSVSYENLEIENFIVDETLSKIGKDYYDLFYTRWEAQISGTLNYSIVISEKTLPQRGTQISIKVNDLDVYQSFVQPRYELIEQSVDEGIYMVFSYLQNYETIQRDLEKGDMRGSGIY